MGGKLNVIFQPIRIVCSIIQAIAHVQSYNKIPKTWFWVPGWCSNGFMFGSKVLLK